MCGITGFINNIDGVSLENKKKHLIRMINSIDYRGPDDFGEFIDKNLYLGHRRLSIIDTSKNGKQPMISKSGKFVISYNGEIYNFKELKKKYLINFNFTSTTDTEVLLELIELIGLEKTLQEINGFFAFALYDTMSKKLFLVRDRIGIKPLFYSKTNKMFMFGSELKTIMSNPLFEKKLDDTSVNSYFSFGYVPQPRSIFKNVYKVYPGQFIEVDSKSLKISKNFYWSLKDKINSKKNYNFNLLGDEIESLVTDSVKMRMVSDVPIGCFLSGGIDSSLVALKMQEQSMKKINTFSVGFTYAGFNEAFVAKKVASILGTNHHQIYFDSNNVKDIISKMPDVYDEPFGDSSQLPTYLLSKFTRENVTVSLSGDGGDELFCGYDRYFIYALFNKYKLKHLFTKLPLKLFKTFRYFLAADKFEIMSRKVSKLDNFLNTKNSIDAYKALVCQFKFNPIVLSKSNFDDPSWEDNSLDTLSSCQFIDQLTYLPDDILTKVDRASMSNSLEVRVPLLDYRLIEKSWEIPNSAKKSSHQSKIYLRNILFKKLPKELFNRNKMGFGVPIGIFLNKALREYSEYYFSEKFNKKIGLLDYKAINNIWKNHQKTQAHPYELWFILMFNMWHEKWMS